MRKALDEDVWERDTPAFMCGCGVVMGWGSQSCIQLINTSPYLSDANSRAQSLPSIPPPSPAPHY